MQTIITSNGPEETEVIAENIGERCKGGEVIELSSDLGGGKTTFVRGLVRGAGSDNHISSPTFTISNTYDVNVREPRESTLQKLHHFDFYRLHDAGLIAHELSDVMGEGSVVIIEWAGIIEHVLPEKRLRLEIQVVGDNKRELVFDYPREMAYLMEIKK